MLRRCFCGILPFGLGLAGILACLAGGYAAWGLASDARRANEKLFKAAIAGVDAVEDRVKGAAANVRATRITSVDYEEKIKSLAQKEARERIATELELERRADQISEKIKTTDARLENAIDSLKLLQKLLGLFQSANVQFDREKIEDASRVLNEVRGEINQIENKVEDVRNFGKAIEGESESSRIARVVGLLVKIVAMIADVDSRFNQVVDRLEAVKLQTLVWQHRADVAIQRTLAIALLVLAWVMAGQYTLFRSGLKRSFRGAA